MNHRIKSPARVLLGEILALFGLLCWLPGSVKAQPPTSADTNVRLAQQWEDMLLLQALDYLQLTPQQYQGMQTLVEATRTPTQEIDNLRAQLKTIVQEQYAALLQGKNPTSSEQFAVIEKEKRIKRLEAALAEEIANRLTPRFTQLLTRRQVARAWHLMHNQTPTGEARRVALYEPASGFVLPEDKSQELSETLVRTVLRRSYSDDVLDGALMPNALAAVSGISYITIDTALLLTFERMQGAPEEPAVSPEEVAVINKQAAQIRSALANDADAYMNQAPANLLNTALRHLTQRLFLSPRLKDVLAERTRLR